jgi:hypothetical protein
MKTVEMIREALENRKGRSAWDKGVNAYALELLENLEWRDAWEYENAKLMRKALLNGAHDWQEYSEGGCALIYNSDIAHRLCNASELKKTREGLKDPNPHETWIDCQARALYQAANLVVETAFA